MLELPEALARVLAEYDGRTADFEEFEVSSALEGAAKDAGELSDPQRKAAFAGVAVFQLQAKSTGQKSGGGTHYAPWMQWKGQEGAVVDYPPLAAFDEPVLGYWARRAG